MNENSNQSLISVEEDKEEIGDFTYYLSSILYLVAMCLSASMIEDLTLVFGVMAGVSECIIIFILPTTFFFIALGIQKSRGQLVGKEEVSLCQKAGVAAFFFAGIIYFMLSNYYNIVKIDRIVRYGIDGNA